MQKNMCSYLLISSEILFNPFQHRAICSINKITLHLKEYIYVADDVPIFPRHSLFSDVLNRVLTLGLVNPDEGTSNRT